MKAINNEMDLAATLPASELARLQRRLAFLEAAIIQMLRDEHDLREWFSAAELADLRLPGLPASRHGVARVAREQHWEARREHARPGDRLVYHFSSLPRRTFAAFIERVLRGDSTPAPDADAAEGTDHGMPAPGASFPVLAGPPPAAPAPPAIATPAWVLPLLRLLRAGGAPLARAVAELPRCLAPGEVCPTIDEAREMLARIGTPGR